MSFPASPVLNEVFIADGKAWRWDGVNWVIPKKPLPEWDEIRSKPTYFDGAIVADTPPATPVDGCLWWDRINSVLYVYDGAAWVEASQSFRTGDLDAWNYIYRVQNADGQDLEEGVIAAVLKFVAGCKTDGIWDAIKSCCVMAGARTLDGALIPLKGSDPTNVNFTPADYNRKTGLKGDGTKHIDSNRNSNADPQDSRHLYAKVSEPEASTLVFKYLIGMTNNYIRIGAGNTANTHAFRCSGTTDFYSNSIPSVGGLGVSRSNATQFNRMFYGTILTETSASVATSNGNQYVFSSNNTTSGGTSPSTRSQSRLNFFSIGEAIDLSKLDSRVSTLMTDFNIAIP